MAVLQDKRQDFLWLVQMIMLRQQDDIKGWAGYAGDAVAASYRIPNDMTARDAALQFGAFISPEFRGGRDQQCPHWMMNLGDPR